MNKADRILLIINTIAIITLIVALLLVQSWTGGVPMNFENDAFSCIEDSITEE